MKSVIVRLEDVYFAYPNAERDALQAINLEIYQGEWLAIIGPNGSGKSTLAKTINGLLVPYQGQVYYKDQLLNADTVWDIRSHIGMVFQNPDNQFVGATVEDDVAFGLENNGVPREEMVLRLNQALEQVRMQDFKKKEPARLSGGQKQRVAIASVIALRPDVIILDESTSMLDPLGRLEIIQLVKEIKEKYNLTVISITHDIDEASLADRILVLEQGKFVRVDSPENIFPMGRDLIKMGLDIPFVEKLRLALIDRGVDVPDHYMEEEELLTWLSQSYLKK